MNNASRLRRPQNNKSDVETRHVASTSEVRNFILVLSVEYMML
jgi:hypothetical protein